MSQEELLFYESINKQCTYLVSHIHNLIHGRFIDNLCPWISDNDKRLLKCESLRSKLCATHIFRKKFKRNNHQLGFGGFLVVRFEQNSKSVSFRLNIHFFWTIDIIKQIIVHSKIYTLYYYVFEYLRESKKVLLIFVNPVQRLALFRLIRIMR